MCRILKCWLRRRSHTSNGGNFRWQSQKLCSIWLKIPHQQLSNMLPFCLEFSIATMLTLQSTMSQMCQFCPHTKSLHKAAAAISEAAWSPWLVVTLLSLLVFADLSTRNTKLNDRSEIRIIVPNQALSKEEKFAYRRRDGTNSFYLNWRLHLISAARYVARKVMIIKGLKILPH